MPRYKLTIEYDGTDFVGWQRQDNGVSIQQSIEEAIFKFCPTEVFAYGAGRTDAGVHAIGQVAHIDIKEFPTNVVQNAINAHLRPLPISIIKAERVEDGFHSRFSAVSRSYLYRIKNRWAPLALDKNRVWWIPVDLDVDAMADAAEVLLGLHDFSTFRATRCQAKSAVKTLDMLKVERCGDEIHIKAHAKSFLHHQVRNIVGSLKKVGAGKWSKADLKQALEACDRKAGGQTAPACGLYLTNVGY